MVINDDKYVYMMKLELMALAWEKGNVKNYGILTVISVIVTIFIFCNYELVSKSSGFLGLPTYSMTKYCLYFIISLVVNYLLLLKTIILKTYHTYAKSAREEIEKLKNMPDEKYPEYVTIQKRTQAARSGALFLLEHMIS